MLDKDLYDWSFFTAGESALDLLGHLARWGLKVGIEPKKKWRARALTDLQEMNALQAQGIDAANSPGSANKHAHDLYFCGKDHSACNARRYH